MDGLCALPLLGRALGRALSSPMTSSCTAVHQEHINNSCVHLGLQVFLAIASIPSQSRNHDWPSRIARCCCCCCMQRAGHRPKRKQASLPGRFSIKSPPLHENPLAACASPAARAAISIILPPRHHPKRISRTGLIDLRKIVLGSFPFAPQTPGNEIHSQFHITCNVRMRGRREKDPPAPIR